MKKEMFKLNKKKLLVLFILIIVILITIFVLNKYDYTRYEQYEDKMNIYGFSTVYDDSAVSTYDNVTRLEALKMVLCVINNYSSFDEFFKSEEEVTIEQATEFFIQTGLINEEIDYNEQVTYIELLEYFVKAKTNILKENITTTNQINVKGINNYTSEQQTVIKDMVENKIVTLYKDKLPLNRVVIKGMLNEMVVNFAERYNTITLKRRRININPQRLPSNYIDLPYTLAEIDKSVYEKQMLKVNEEFKSPIELYREIKDSYRYIDFIIGRYLNQVLNVNYNNLDENIFKSNIRKYSFYYITDDVFDRYFEYVKSNEIIIKGEHMVQDPVIYYDGSLLRVRVKIDLKIENAKQLTNVLFMDLEEENDIQYNADNTVIIDIPLSKYDNYDLHEIIVRSIFVEQDRKDVVEENTIEIF